MGFPLHTVSPFLAALDAELSQSVLLTLAIALSAGAFLTVVAKRLKIPGIVLLLFGGVVLGPEGWNVVQPDNLGSILNVLVALAVGLILFEGGLTLNIEGYRAAGSVIRRLLTIGVVVTWAGTAAAIYFLYGFNPTFCLLAGSLVIVTGPTVIQPILKRTRLSWNLHHTLHWEGVLIDPVGVFAAVLAFEWAMGASGGEALGNLGLRVLGGLTIGFVGGQLTCFLLKHRLVAEEVVNVFMVGVAIFIFGTTEAPHCGRWTAQRDGGGADHRGPPSAGVERHCRVQERHHGPAHWLRFHPPHGAPRTGAVRRVRADRFCPRGDRPFSLSVR